MARALTLLRLTRWLSLVRRRRDPKTGRIQGNLYVLHDEPLSPFEAMQLDADYLGLVSQALIHAAKAVQIVGMNTLKEIAEDPLLSGRTLPTRLQVLAQRMARHGWTTPGYPQEGADHESEEGQEALLRNAARPSSESEAGPKPALDGDVLWTVVRVTAKQAGVMGLAAGESVCYIGCHLLESSGGDWGYKSLDESVHPYYYSCPLRYLDMAPVQSSEWRERVHRFHAGRAV